MDLFESDFYLLTRKLIDQYDVIDVIPKIESSDTQALELMELLSVYLVDNSNLKIMLPINNHTLFKNLQQISFEFYGYCVGSSECEKMIPFRDIYSLLNDKTVTKIILQFRGELSHDVGLDRVF